MGVSQPTRFYVLLHPHPTPTYTFVFQKKAYTMNSFNAQCTAISYSLASTIYLAPILSIGCILLSETVNHRFYSHISLDRIKYHQSNLLFNSMRNSVLRYSPIEITTTVQSLFRKLPIENLGDFFSTWNAECAISFITNASFYRSRPYTTSIRPWKR